MATAIGTIVFIGIAGWLIKKWDRQRKKDMKKDDEYPFDEYNNYN